MDLLTYIEEQIELEKLSYDEICDEGNANSFGAGVALGAMETLQKIKTFLKENP